MSNRQMPTDCQKQSSCITNLSFSHNGKLLAANFLEQCFTIFDAVSGQQLCSWAFSQLSDQLKVPVHALRFAWAPNSKQLMACPWAAEQCYPQEFPQQLHFLNLDLHSGSWTPKFTYEPCDCFVTYPSKTDVSVDTIEGCFSRCGKHAGG